jgi:hypothetical protein
MKKGDCVYYTDWEDGNTKYPAYVLQARRTWATVKLFSKKVYENKGGNECETWDVPIEDLQLTDNFKVQKSSLFGFTLIWEK